MRRASYWCEERNLALAILSYLRRYGFSLLLSSSSSDIFLTFSKTNLVEAGAHLPPQFVQGKNIVDLSAYDEANHRVILGVVASRIFALALSRSEDVAKLVARFLFAAPELAVESYNKLKDLGYDFTSVNTAKLYKVLLVARSIGRIRRFYTGAKTVHALVIVPRYLKFNEGVFRELVSALDTLLKHLVEKHNDGKTYTVSVYGYRPRAITSGAPDYVDLELIYGQPLSEGMEKLEMNFVEAMGYDYIGCAKCQYIKVCGKYF